MAREENVLMGLAQFRLDQCARRNSVLAGPGSK